jgi:hypothetical protein
MSALIYLDGRSSPCKSIAPVATEQAKRRMFWAHSVMEKLHELADGTNRSADFEIKAA